MTTRWREIGSTVVRWGKRLVPPLISVGLVSWLVWKITPARLFHTLASPVFPWLVLATLVQLIVLFLWDTVSLWWLFSQPDRPIPFRTMLRARADSVLWSAVNLEIGQGMFAWTIAEIQGTPLSAAVARCVVLAVFDFGTLQSLALLGSFLHSDPLLNVLRWIPVGSVAGLILLVLLLHFLPASWQAWLQGKTWGSWLTWWTWRHSFLLGAQRLILFLLVLLYAGVCLAICHLSANVRVVLGVIPFVLLAESLPGTAGLGERETALVYLLRPANDEQRALLLTFGLTWSLIIIWGRLAIGLASRWLPRRQTAERQSGAA